MAGNLFYRSFGNTVLESTQWHLLRSLAIFEPLLFLTLWRADVPFILALGAAGSGHEDSLPRSHPRSWFRLRRARTGWKPHTCWQCRSTRFDAQACCFLRQRDLHTETQTGLLCGSLGEIGLCFSPRPSGRKLRDWAPSPHLSVLCLFTWVHLTLGTSFALVSSHNFTPGQFVAAPASKHLLHTCPPQAAVRPLRSSLSSLPLRVTPAVLPPITAIRVSAQTLNRVPELSAKSPAGHAHLFRFPTRSLKEQV